MFFDKKWGILIKKEFVPASGNPISGIKKGLKYGTLGAQENPNCTVITMRMKGNRRRWSEAGANYMAKLLYRKENGELIETVNRYNETLIFRENIQGIIEILSAAARSN